MAVEQIKMLKPDLETGRLTDAYPETESSMVIDFTEGAKKAFATDKTIGYVPVTPDYFSRTELFSSNKTTITIPTGMSFMVNGRYYETSSDHTLTLLNFLTVNERKGKDVYIYGVENLVSNEATFVLSMNSTYPTGYTAETSRKLGGFHCLCAAVGAIEDHPLSNYEAGDVLPTSRWDLWHRPVSDPEGMVYDEGLDKWVDIYLPSVSGSKLLSVFGGTIADGASNPKFHWYKFTHWFAKSKKRLLLQPEFMKIAAGSNVETNIKGSADPGTTGAHIDTNDRRMISWIGCEDCCGVMWQWGAEAGSLYDSASWANAWDENSDPEMRGSHRNVPVHILGGECYAWSTGSIGVLASFWGRRPLYLGSSVSGRGISDPR